MIAAGFEQQNGVAFTGQPGPDMVLVSPPSFLKRQLYVSHATVPPPAPDPTTTYS